MSKKSGISDDMPDFFVFEILCFRISRKKIQKNQKKKSKATFILGRKLL
jgi:hypothetical protein